MADVRRQPRCSSPRAGDHLVASGGVTGDAELPESDQSGGSAAVKALRPSNVARVMQEMGEVVSHEHLSVLTFTFRRDQLKQSHAEEMTTTVALNANEPGPPW